MPELFSDWNDSGLPPDSPGTVVTVGTFDGVHLGHRDVLARIVERARELRLRSVLVTFEPHPLVVINPEAAPPLLTVGAERLELVAESGIDFMAIVPFTANLQRYTAEQFVNAVLRRRFHVRHLVIGHDHGFGRAREGDVDVLRGLGRDHGFAVEVVEAVKDAEGRPVSSTLIRRAVAGGDLRRAAEGLGRLYSVSGDVLHGDRRGRLLGYPTL
ncbi:MAG TPA: adenylyltransferase/cytidyltransferase family protein, partial [Gemmatimonadaceae bacterium]